MTRFWRSGHSRYSRDGYEYDVKGHWVDREIWDRDRGHGMSHGDVRLSTLGINHSRTARFISPNARCPVCDAPVFYYQNEFGSRVFFDEIGPPWPKHPCTDIAGSDQNRHRTRTEDQDIYFPTKRSDEDATEIELLLKHADIDLETRFRDKFGTIPWKIAIVRKVILGKDGYLILADSLEEDRGKLFLKIPKLRRRIYSEDVFAISRGRLSYVARNSQVIVDTEVTRLRSASQLLDLAASR